MTLEPPGTMPEYGSGRWLLVPRPIPVGVPIGGHVVLFGWGVKESTGAEPAELDIYLGGSATGLLAFPISLAAGESTREWFGPQGVDLTAGFFSQTALGSVAGSILIANYG